MPGYHEESDHDDELAEHDGGAELVKHDDAETRISPARPSNAEDHQAATSSTEPSVRPSNNAEPPVSKPSSSARPPAPNKRKRSQSASAEPQNLLTCPICSKSIDTDNRGLNEHIDFCLSKGAIREAQASASHVNNQPRLALKPSDKPRGAIRKRVRRP